MMINKEANNPAYKVLVPTWEGGEPWFELTAQQRKTILGGKPHRVATVDKHQPAHVCASTCESLLAVYPDAISVGGVLGAGPERADVGFGGFMMLAGSAMFIWLASSFGLNEWFTWLFLLPVILASLLAAINLLKTGYFLPKDAPVVFNRRSRQVTFSQLRFHTFWKFWVPPGFNEPITVPWESVQARSYKFTQHMGSSLRDSYRLEIWAPAPENPKDLLVKEPIGYLGWYEDEKLWGLYEHIRRYMEEGGPAIQQGEDLRRPRRGSDLPPFPESVLSMFGGPALSDDEVDHLAGRVPTQ